MTDGRAADRVSVEWIRTERRPTYALAAAVVLCVLWYSFVRGARVPILGFVDLAVHEAGHVFFLWAPRDLMLVMGNGFQALVPAVFAGAFVVKHRDLAGGAAAFAWCASSLQDASVYIADAPYRRLPLLGPETSHDWWQLLSSRGWLDAADELAGAVWFAGLLVWLAAGAVLVVGARWDRAWLDGRPGTLYLPRDRAEPAAARVTGTLAGPLGLHARRLLDDDGSRNPDEGADGVEDWVPRYEDWGPPTSRSGGATDPTET